jgi:hypothetical protein
MVSVGLWVFVSRGRVHGSQQMSHNRLGQTAYHCIRDALQSVV